MHPKNNFDRFTIVKYFENIIKPAIIISETKTSKMFTCVFNNKEYLVSYYWKDIKPKKITRIVIYNVGKEYNVPLSAFEYQQLINKIFGYNDVNTEDIGWLLAEFETPKLWKLMNSAEISKANFYVKCGILHKGKSDDKQKNKIYYLPAENKLKISEYYNLKNSKS